MTATVKQVRSPAAPSINLKDSFEDARRIYRQFSHATFSSTEIASSLGLSSLSSSLRRRTYAMVQYLLIEELGGGFRISQHFHALDAAPSGSVEFKKAALRSIENVTTFAELLTEFRSKLPDQAIVAQRLEKQKSFTVERAKEVAATFDKSMRFAGVLDSNGNILPIRDSGQEKETPVPTAAEPRGGADTLELTDRTSDAEIEQPLRAGLRRSEIPLADGRVAIVLYPQDLASKEATKIGNVLSALVE